MLLGVDVGNTQTVIGIFNRELMHNWRISTHPLKTADEWALSLSELLTIEGLKIDGINSAVISSVVPDATQALNSMCRKTLKLDPLFVTSEVTNIIKVKTDNPREVGADRIANAAAVYKEYGGPAIVVDMGTATTFDVISSKGEYVGGVIAPGVETSLKALVERAARLSDVAVEAPPRVIGKNTTESLQSGVVYGFAGQIDALVTKIIEELGVESAGVKVIATGGLADMVVDACKTITDKDPLLTLKGLRIIRDLNR